MSQCCTDDAPAPGSDVNWSSNVVVVMIVPPPLIWRRPVAQGRQQGRAFPACNAVAYAPQSSTSSRASFSAASSSSRCWISSGDGGRVGGGDELPVICYAIIGVDSSYGRDADRINAIANGHISINRKKSFLSFWYSNGPGVAASASSSVFDVHFPTSRYDFCGIHVPSLRLIMHLGLVHSEHPAFFHCLSHCSELTSGMVSKIAAAETRKRHQCSRIGFVHNHAAHFQRVASAARFAMVSLRAVNPAASVAARH